MRYRKLTATGDYSFGRGQADFWRDQPEGVAQAAETRLQLYLGEWFLDTRDGMAWKTKVLGNRTADTRDPTIRARLLGTTGCTGIDAYASQLDRDTRAFAVQATLNTQYGSAPVTTNLKGA